MFGTSFSWTSISTKTRLLTSMEICPARFLAQSRIRNVNGNVCNIIVVTEEAKLMGIDICPRGHPSLQLCSVLSPPRGSTNAKQRIAYEPFSFQLPERAAKMRDHCLLLPSGTFGDDIRRQRSACLAASPARNSRNSRNYIDRNAPSSPTERFMSLSRLTFFRWRWFCQGADGSGAFS